jgi:hypothetical protein
MLADWEAIADSGALDDTLVRYLEQEAQDPKGGGGVHFSMIRVFCTVTSVVQKGIWMTKSLVLRVDQKAI